MTTAQSLYKNMVVCQRHIRQQQHLTEFVSSFYSKSNNSMPTHLESCICQMSILLASDLGSQPFSILEFVNSPQVLGRPRRPLGGA